jgi:hypothetical protein
VAELNRQVDAVLVTESSDGSFQTGPRGDNREPLASNQPTKASYQSSSAGKRQIVGA